MKEESVSKRCPRCGEQSPAALFFTKGGHKRPYCPPCMRAYKREAYHKNPEPAKQSAKQYAAAHQEATELYQREYREAHREELRAAAVVYRQENREAIQEKQYARQRTEVYREQQRVRRARRYAVDDEYRRRILAYGRISGQKHYKKNRSSILERCQKAYWQNPEAGRAKTKHSVALWRARHPDQHRAIQARRRAIRRGAAVEGFDEVAHRAWLTQWQHGRCYHCNGPLGDVPHLDHLVPVVKKGVHAPDNLVLSCPRCNASKNAKLLWSEWAPPLSAVYHPFIWQDEVDAVFGKGCPVRVLSTFFLSDRNTPDWAARFAELRRNNPRWLFLTDFEWRFHRRACVNMVRAKLGLNNGKAIGARRTQAVAVDTEIARDFLEAHHVQGFGRGSLYLGLVYEDQLVAVSAWIIASDHVELNRLAFDGSVSGGFSKLLNAFERHPEYSGQPITSFVDTRYATGAGYLSVGFVADGETDNPVYYYVTGGGMYHRMLYRKTSMASRLCVFDPELTERENARINGAYRFFGLKQRRFVYAGKNM